jgi:hypothetical protein
MKLRNLRTNYLLLEQEARTIFVITYREKREKDLTSLQEFDLTSTKKEKRVGKADKKIAVTTEGLALLKQMGLI